MSSLRFNVATLLWLIAAALTSFAPPAAAHKASDSYLSVKVQGRDVAGQWDIALRDIDFAIGLDADANGEITWGEVKARHDAIAAWALPRLALQRGGGDCGLRVTEHLVDSHTDGAYAVLRFAGQCPAGGDALTLQYRLLFDIDTLHRGLLKLELDGIQHAAVLSPSSGALAFKAGETSRLKQFGHYIVEGVWHIWIGFDHILFLLALLLPAVLVHEVVQRSRVWRGVTRFGDAFREVLWVVTAFTVAHSITLSLAALEVVTLPSRLVESAIALSVVLAALNNVWPVVEKRRWLVAFVFGLIHGFGFASVLADLGLPRDALVLSLFGFNLGVELGQLAIVAVFLPVAFLLRDTPFYRKVVFIGGSVVTMLLALGWFVERAFDLKLMGG
ncbi:MAG: HupE/UreJ family protein [Betaproteobacteria bacterium]|nr:HupE/UreJ family protein [Betaproteobacteria bacterium]